MAYCLTKALGCSQSEIKQQDLLKMFNIHEWEDDLVFGDVDHVRYM